MDLPNLLNKLKTSPSPAKQFVAIEISPYAVKSAIWQVRGETTEVVALGSVQVWDTESEDDLLAALDLSLSDAYAGTETEPNEVIFGLPETWVSGDSIAEGKKPLIKTICQKLALKPVGFVVTLEAIVHHLQESAGSPPSAVLLNLAPQELVVSLLFLGTIEGTQVVGRSSSLSADVEEGLARFPAPDNFPSRMILFNGREDLEGAKQELIDHDWQSKLPFLHIPKIETLAKDVSIEAVAVAGGAEVARSLGLTAPDEVSDSTTPAEAPPSPPQTPLPPEPPSSTQPEAPPPASSSELPNVAMALGFESIELNNGNQSQPPAKETTTPFPSSSTPGPKEATSPPGPEPTVSSPPPPPAPARSLQTQLKGGLRTFRSLLPRPKRGFKLASSRSFLGRRRLVLIAMVLLAGMASATWLLPTATVTITISQAPVSKEVTFTLDPQATTAAIADQVIPVKQDSLTVSGNKSAATTGTQTIGEKASGKVAVYNRTTSPKSFPSGTILQSNNLKFLTDDSITVASASAKENSDFSITIEPSKTEVAITASAIGDQYNLPANTQFLVANFGQDTYIANATTPLSGGYSEQVQVVSQTDQSELQAALLAQLETQVKTQVSERSSGTQGTIPTQDIDISQEDYSAEVGEQANTLALDMTLTQTIYVYSNDDVALMTEALVQDQIPADYTVNAGATEIEVKETTVNEDGTATITAQIDLMLVPEIDTADLEAQIAGRSPTAVDATLSAVPGYRSAEIVVSPGFFPFLPLRAEKISVSVVPQ